MYKIVEYKKGTIIFNNNIVTFIGSFNDIEDNFIKNELFSLIKIHIEHNNITLVFKLNNINCEFVRNIFKILFNIDCEELSNKVSVQWFYNDDMILDTGKDLEDNTLIKFDFIKL